MNSYQLAFWVALLAATSPGFGFIVGGRSGWKLGTLVWASIIGFSLLFVVLCYYLLLLYDYLGEL